MKALKRLSLILLTSFAFSLPVIAQESTPEPDTPVVNDDFEQIQDDTLGFVNEVIDSLDNLIAPYIAVALPLVMVLVQLTKGIFPNFSVDTHKRVWSVVVWVVFIFAARAGFAEQFNSLVPALATILATVTGVTVTSAGSSVVFDQVKGIPVLGYSRSESE